MTSELLVDPLDPPAPCLASQQLPIRHWTPACAPTTSTIRSATASSLPKYRAGPRAGNATSPGRTTSAQRRDRLTVLQTSLIGALVMALAGIQAFMYSPPVPERLQGPVICLLTVIVVALPLLIGRWTGVVPGGDPYRWTDLAAATDLGAATGWFVSSTAWHLAADRSAPHPMAAAAVAAGALAVLLVTWLLGRARNQPAS